MKTMKTIFFYYCLAVSVFITVSGILTSQNSTQLLMQSIFLPVTVYFVYNWLSSIVKMFKPSKDGNNNPGSKSNPIVIILTFVLFVILFATSLARIVDRAKTRPEVKAKVTPTLKPSPTPKILYVQLKEEYSQNIVYALNEAATGSALLGVMENKPYQYVNKIDNWYEILFDGKSHGFIDQKYVTNNP